MSRPKLNLLAKFSLTSFFILAGVAIALAWGIQWRMEQSALRGGSQIRRSSKSVVSNIVEGFGRRRYKNEFIKICQNTPQLCWGDEWPTLSPGRLCHNGENSEKCHAELVSASNRIKYLRDPEINSG